MRASEVASLLPDEFEVKQVEHFGGTDALADMRSDTTGSRELAIPGRRLIAAVRGQFRSEACEQSILRRNQEKPSENSLLPPSIGGGDPLSVQVIEMQALLVENE